MGPLLVFKTQYESDALDSNHMLKGLERVSQNQQTQLAGSL